MPIQPLAVTRFMLGGLILAGLVATCGWVISPLTYPATPTDGVVVIAWWLCVALSIWFLGSVLLWRHALRSSGYRLGALARRIALPGSRKLAESTLALSLILGTGACSLGTSSNAPRLSLVSTGVGPAQTAIEQATTEQATTFVRPPTTEPAGFDSEPTSTQPAEQADTSPADTSQDPVPIEKTEEEPGEADQPLFEPLYEVERGDNLWSIAQRTLAKQTGAEPTTAEVATYWRELIAEIRDSLASGDPNLIFPGEILALPNPNQ